MDENNLLEDFEQKVLLFYRRPSSIRATAKMFQTTPYKIGLILTKHNVPKHDGNIVTMLQNIQREQTCLEKYGVTCSLVDPAIKQKRDATMCSKYGVKYSGQSAELTTKRENTCIEKYGTKHPCQAADVKAKTKQTNQAKYGADYYMQTAEFIEQVKQTSQAKYGTDYYLQTNEFRERSKQTCLDKYGVEYSFQSVNNKQKSLISKKKNKTMTSSCFEKDLENFLIANNIEYKTQYKTQAYPFHCDFYLPKTDAFIELNLNWTHGKHFFNPEAKGDIDLLKVWQQRAVESDYYKSAIDVWTIRDPLKRDTALKNNLNYICIFNQSELESLKTKILVEATSQVKDGMNHG